MTSLPIKKSDQNIILSILGLALPVIVENILQVFLASTDTYFISQLGAEALVGVSATGLIMNIYIAFFTALGISTTALISRNMGANKKPEAKKVLKQAVILAILLGLVMGALNLGWGKNILLLLGISKDQMPSIYPYFLSVCGPLVFLSLMTTLSSGLRGAGDTKSPMKISLLVNLVNIVLDYFFIFGAYTWPGWGILGAGLATSLARLIGCILLIRQLRQPKKPLELDLFKDWKLDLALQKSLLKIGFPSALEKLIMRLGQLVYGALIIKLGTLAYASHNIAGTIESYSYLPALGFGVAGTVLVGQELGRGNKKKARKIGLISYFLSSLSMIVIALFFSIFAPSLAGLFTKDPQIQALVVKVLRIIAFFQPMLCATLVLTAILQGVGDTKFPLYSTFIGIWLIRILGVYFLGIKWNMGLVGVWLSYALDVSIRAVILMHRYLKGKWTEIDLE